MSQQINLFNPIFRKPEFSFTSANTILYGAGIAAAVIVLYSFYADYRLRQLQHQAQAVDQQYQDATARRDQLAAVQGGRKANVQLEAELAELDAKLKMRQHIIEMLKGGALGATTGFSEYMQAFARQSVNGLWLTGFDIAASGNDLVISGRALSPDLVPTYLQRLNHEQTMQGHQFAAMSISRPPPQAGGTPAADREAKPAVPGFLEFTISTAESTDAQKATATGN